MSGASAELTPGIVRRASGGPARLSNIRVGRHRVTRADLFGVTLAAIGSLVAATFSLQLWNAHLHVPFVYGSDGMISLATVKWAVSGGGWLYTNHQTGAPFGLELFDYPLTTDNLNYVAMWLIGRVTSNPARVMNIFFLLTFPAEAIAGYAVLRWMKISVASSVVAAILFADSPYHLLRNETHLLLSEYISVPLATYMIISILDGRRILTGGLRPFAWRSLLSSRNLFMLLLCVVIGSCGVYYAVFAIIILIAASLASGARLRSWAPPAQAAVIIIAIGAVIFINDLPTAIYRHEHGTDPIAAHRLPQESEIYALKLAEMVLPVPGNRIPALAAIRFHYDTTNPVPSEDGQQSLGIVGVIGLAALLLIGIGAIIGAGRAGPSLTRLRKLAFAAIVAFVVGTLGGISALIGYLISPQIRGWDRISIFIDFFALAAVAIGLDVIARRWLRGRRPWALVGLAVVLVVGIFDQSSLLAIPTYAANGASWGSDSLFVSAIQQVLPPGSSVFEMPYMAFPEVPPINNMQDYDPLRGYIHSTDLDWSYPVMEGRPADWDSQTVSLPASTLIDGLIAAGFQGLWIDHDGYADAGAQIISEVQALLGAGPMNSPDGRFSFFSLRPYAARLRAAVTGAELANLRRAILHPPVVVWANGFYPPDPDGSHWSLDDSVATADNELPVTRRAEFFSDVQTLAKGRFNLTITAPGGVVKHFVITSTPKAISFSFPLAPGTHEIEFSSNATTTLAPGNPDQLAVHYGTPVISGAGMAPFFPGNSAAGK